MRGPLLSETNPHTSIQVYLGIRSSSHVLKCFLRCYLRPTLFPGHFLFQVEPHKSGFLYKKPSLQTWTFTNPRSCSEKGPSFHGFLSSPRLSNLTSRNGGWFWQGEEIPISFLLPSWFGHYFGELPCKSSFSRRTKGVRF